MQDLYKVNVIQLYLFWKNLSIGLFLLIVMQVISTWLNPLLSIFVAILCAFILFVRIYKNKTSRYPTYMIVCYALMSSIVIYALASLLINLMHVWGWISVREEFLFFSTPFISILLLSPIAFITLFVTYIRRRSVHRYLDKRFGIVSDVFIKGKLGAILTHESRCQLRNLTLLFGILTVVDWTYYLNEFHYEEIINGRDLYIFFWFNIIGFVIYEIYLFIHNFSIDETLKQTGELIMPNELFRLSPKTYYRFYVICGDKIFINFDCINAEYPDHAVLDTPYFVSSPGESLSFPEVKRMIADKSGLTDGELRFFYGFQAPGLDRHVVMRYFYFLDGDVEDYPNLTDRIGVWLTFDDIKSIYHRRPHAIAPYLLADTARILTISRASKLFDEKGFRKLKLKSYIPSFSLDELRKSKVDFQSDKWINISEFNEDVPLFKIRRWLRKTIRRDAYNIV
jgi:hypothetical protein